MTNGKITQKLPPLSRFIIKLTLLALLPLFFSSCQKEETGFRMSYQMDFEIPAGLGVFDTHVFETQIVSNKDFFYNLNDVEESQITRIRPQSATLFIPFANVEFGFVERVVVEIFSDTDNVGREIFYREPVPLNTGFQIDLIPSLPDVMDFVIQEEFNIRVELRLRDISPQFIETRFDFDFLAST